MGFLEQVTADLIRRVGYEQLSRYTIVFPMNRASLFMRECLREQVKQACPHPIVAPEFTTISGLVDSLSSLNADDEIRSVCTLYRIYKQHTGSQLSLDVFYGWGKQLLQDFSSVDMALVDADALFSNAVYAHRLELPDLAQETRERLEMLMGKTWNEVEQRAYREEFQQLWNALPDIYRDFQHAQQQEGVGYTGARLRQVVEHIADIDLGERKFAFVGFNYLLKGEKALLMALKDRSLFYWDYDPSFRTNRDAYRFIRQHIADGLTNALPDEETEVSRPKIQMVMTAGDNAQAQFVHPWLQGKTGKTAIVIADEAMLEPVIYALPNDVSEHVNITKGYPLRNTQVYADIIAYLTDPKHDKQADEKDYTGVLTRLLQTWNTEAPQATDEDPDDTDLCERKTWQELLTEESIYQATKVIARFLTLIQEGVLTDIADLKTLRNILRRHLEQTSLPFHGEPVTDIQVMGVLETRVLDFDNLLVLNVEEGVVPQHKQDRSFIPYYLRKYYGLETNDESAAAYAYNFFRLLRRAKDITLLFSEATTGMGKKAMSRFLMQILTSGEFMVEKKRLVEPCQTTKQNHDLIDPERRSLLERWQKDGVTKRTLSPSAISNFLDCRMRFYLQNVLHLDVTQGQTPIMPINDLGSLVHATIRAAYREICPILPCVVDKARLQAFLDDPHALDRALEEAYLSLDTIYTMSEHSVENLVAKTHARKVLQNDLATIEREGSLTMLIMEQECRVPIPVLMPDGTIGDVHVGGVVDRIDKVGNTVRILDYKTGSYDAKKMQAEDLSELFVPNNDKRYIFQTLLYCLAATYSPAVEKGSTLMPGLLFTRKGLDSFDWHLYVANEPITDFAAQCQDTFVPRLKELVAEIISTTSFPKKARKDCSEFCPFKPLCY